MTSALIGVKVVLKVSTQKFFEVETLLPSVLRPFNTVVIVPFFEEVLVKPQDCHGFCGIYKTAHTVHILALFILENNPFVDEDNFGLVFQVVILTSIVLVCVYVSWLALCAGPIIAAIFLEAPRGDEKLLL